MIYSEDHTPISIIPLREREPETNVQLESFTDVELDAIAPFTEQDRESFRCADPTPEAEAILQRRIELAKELKYGTPRLE